MRGHTQQVNCKSCKKPFMARTADINRGWGKFCSKSCKAIRQVKTHGRTPKAKGHYPRHDGLSPMKHKTCDECGAPAINGVYTSGGIVWGCEVHHDTTHPFSSDALGQW